MFRGLGDFIKTHVELHNIVRRSWGPFLGLKGNPDFDPLSRGRPFKLESVLGRLIIFGP